ncbi:AraC family transcriptional regulator [Flavobacterium sp. 90]|uniref:helix-turn-helix domain-containing protein n=1 Tax=unclassified Flavobacterium TaxID=196869 RepID=UPI000EB3AE80|nr:MULTISPECIES: AraC family transcriptional regulator [unclassified Flavobacterium]RKR09158.1 AraC family transcriptional regulator [Flavobacterium sp. 81]TCK52942.1 AraC family transcriptional regulator [Flavobacterium sp. 90]
MEKLESIEDFYLNKALFMPDNLKKEIGHFNVFVLDEFMGCSAKPIPYSRKDYFKISLIIGKNKVHYADKVVEIENQALFFANPQIPYNWEQLEEQQTGFFCVFTEAFFHQFGNLKEYPVFKPNGSPVFAIDDEQVKRIKSIFEQMITEINSDYTYKYDVLRNLVFDLIHSAMKMQPANISVTQHSNASSRISSLFLELLERQFPIENSRQRFGLRSAADFADQLTIHVNHLNRALKETTQKTTSEIIAERILQEAKILLKHTDWNISEIAYSLGFEEPTHFNNFFKKNIQITPRQFRTV